MTIPTNMAPAVRRAMLQAAHLHGSMAAAQTTAPACRKTQTIVLGRFRPSSSSSSFTRSYASAAASSSGGGGGGGTSSSYVSPYQDIFDSIHQGKTFLGTTEFQMPSETKYLKCGIPESSLRFKTTAFGKLLEAPYVRPMEHRIILQVHMRHVPLTDAERLVLREIVGQRLDDETGVLQLSSSQFGSRIENKRHVVSMLERAVERAKVLAARLEEEVERMEQQQV